MRSARLAISLLVFVAACGAPPAVTVGTSPSPLSADPLFAILENGGTTNPYDTVAIVGLDGQTRAKTTFTPMPVPALGCMGAILPASAHVAAGKVFYADGHGVVRSLATDGTVSTVATFPMTSAQQMLSFAVSVDGNEILGTIFEAPRDAFPCDGSTATGGFTFDAYSATGGSAGRLVYHQSWIAPSSVMALTGWDSVGPTGTYPSVWASQGGGPASTLGVFVRIDASTMRVLAPFSGPSSCQVWSSVQSGAFVCTHDPVITGGGTAAQSVDSPVSVRRADGSELWHFTLTSMNEANSPILAPDERHVTICCADVAGPGFAEWMIGQDGGRAMLANGFVAAGWLDSNTMLGTLNSDPLKQPPFALAYVRSDAPTQATSMGFSGAFVGKVGA